MSTVLVVGATGTQGGAVARALRARGVSVRALVRDPNGCAAEALGRLGVDLIAGSFEDAESLTAAAGGVSAVFSVQPPPGAQERNSERLTAIQPTTQLQLIAADDIGRAAAAAIGDPARFDRVALELAGDLMTPPQIAAALSSARGAAVEAVTLGAEALIARGQSPRWVKTQEWYNAAGCPARPEMMERFGLAPTRFADWARANADRLTIADR